jgi:high-affinity Fe2+/Pb2+ permease
MKKIIILLVAVVALFSFSCNKYCHCKRYIDGEQDKNYKGNFVNELKECKDYEVTHEIEGVTEEIKCK